MNEAAQFGVTIRQTNNTPAWKAFSVRRLSASENGSRHNVYVKVLTPTGERDRDPALLIGWTWEGRRDNEPAPPVALDKADSDTGHGNIPIMSIGQKIAVWISGDGLWSDTVEGMHTNHPDEGPSNTRGHFSYEVIFQRAESATQPPEPPVDGEVARLKAAMREAVAVLEAVL